MSTGPQRDSCVLNVNADLVQVSASFAYLPAGDWDVNVFNSEAGYATWQPDSAPLVVHAPLQVGAVTPGMGSCAGGSNLTISGAGFDILNITNNRCSHIHRAAVCLKLHSESLMGLFQSILKA